MKSHEEVSGRGEMLAKLCTSYCHTATAYQNEVCARPPQMLCQECTWDTSVGHFSCHCEFSTTDDTAVDDSGATRHCL